MVNFIRKNYKSASIHLIIWTLILLTNFVFLKNYLVIFDLKFHILTWVLYIVLFYITYLFLVPGYLLKKRIFSFMILSLVFLGGAYFIHKQIAESQFITVFRHNDIMHMPPPGQGQPMHPRFGEEPPSVDRELMQRPEFDRMLENGKPFGGRPDFGRKIFPVTGLLLVFFASISAKVYLRLRNDEKQRDELEKERIATELGYLKQQVNPHFLFNTLNNLYSLSIKNPDLTPDALLKVSSILRYTLYKTDNLPALLSDEIEIMNAFIDFQKMRSKNSLPVEYEVTGEVGGHAIEPFILLPLVENAFKYGMADIKNSFIRIQLTINPGRLQFYVENKKNKLAVSDPEHSGIGLKNIQRRLNLVYPDNHIFRIDDKDETFSVLVELPVENSKLNELHSH
jgi:two-component system, LytTR family, sensor kinase